MARFKDKARLLELLAETPVVSFACKKVGLDRTTFYRWYKDDKDFRDKVDHILSIGRKNINDMAEASVIKEINNGNMRANIFWLQHNDPRYRPVRTTYVNPETHRHDLAPGEICKACGYREPLIEDYDKQKGSQKNMTDKQLASELYKRVKSINTRKQSEQELYEIISDFIEQNNIKVEWRIVDGSKPADNDEPKES